jgi:hypothetical protein
VEVFSKPRRKTLVTVSPSILLCRVWGDEEREQIFAALLSYTVAPQSAQPFYDEKDDDTTEPRRYIVMELYPHTNSQLTS